MPNHPRPGPRPTTSDEGPHRQLDQRATPALWGELMARVFGTADPSTTTEADATETPGLPDVVEGISQVSPESSRAVFLRDMAHERTPETSLAPGRRLEPVHLHGIADTSLHLVLPTPRGDELVRLGWAEPHQYADFGTEYLIYGPRDENELQLVVSIITESLAYARGNN